MARNKYPEQTVKKILDISMQLFSEKGYDKTSIQDIVNALGMSKGAIYHHFKSKEDILNALGDSFYESSELFEKIKQRSDLSGIEKIRQIFKAQISNEEKTTMDKITMNIWNDPKFFMVSMKENLTVNVMYILPFLEEGIMDGSIRQQNAKCASEVLILLLNYWLLSPITGYDTKRLEEKVHYFREICDSLGMPIIDDAIEKSTIDYFKLLASYT